MPEESTTPDQEQMATAFVEGYGRTWRSWDFDGFVDLFSDDVVYVEHPVDETVVGREAIGRYIRREQAEAGTVSVRIGRPIVEGSQVVAEFWTTMSNREGEIEGMTGPRSSGASSPNSTRAPDAAHTFASTGLKLRGTSAHSTAGASSNAMVKVATSERDQGR